MPEPKLVRVTVNGYKRTVSADHATNAGLTVLDEPAVDDFGRPLPQTKANGRKPKPRTSVDAAAAKKTTKTSARKRAASKSTAEKTA